MLRKEDLPPFPSLLRHANKKKKGGRKGTSMLIRMNADVKEEKKGGGCWRVLVRLSSGLSDVTNRESL